MIKSLFFPLFTSRNICFGYLLESPHWGDSNKYPQHMFPWVLNTVFFDISNYLPHLEPRNRSVQIVVFSEFCRYIECRYKEVWLYLLSQAASFVIIDLLKAKMGCLAVVTGTKRFDSEKAGDREVQRTMLELLNQMDGFQPNAMIKVWCFVFFFLLLFLCLLNE